MQEKHEEYKQNGHKNVTEMQINVDNGRNNATKWDDALLHRIEGGGEGEEGDVPVDGDLIGGVGRLVVQIGLVRRYVFWVLDAIGLCILTRRVRSTGEEAGKGALRMTIREPVMRMGRRMRTKAGHVTETRSILAKDVIEATLGVGSVCLIPGQPIGVHTLDAPPAATLGVATPEEVRLCIAIRRTEDGVHDVVE